MAGNSITMTGTLVHSCFLLPDLLVCKPCTILQYTTYEAVNMAFLSRAKHFMQFLVKNIFLTLTTLILAWPPSGWMVGKHFLYIWTFRSIPSKKILFLKSDPLLSTPPTSRQKDGEHDILCRCRHFINFLGKIYIWIWAFYLSCT